MYVTGNNTNNYRSNTQIISKSQSMTIPNAQKTNEQYSDAKYQKFDTLLSKLEYSRNSYDNLLKDIKKTVPAFQSLFSVASLERQYEEQHIKEFRVFNQKVVDDKNFLQYKKNQIEQLFDNIKQLNAKLDTKQISNGYNYLLTSNSHEELSHYVNIQNQPRTDINNVQINVIQLAESPSVIVQLDKVHSQKNGKHLDIKLPQIQNAISVELNGNINSATSKIKSMLKEHELDTTYSVEGFSGYDSKMNETDYIVISSKEKGSLLGNTKNQISVEYIVNNQIINTDVANGQDGHMQIILGQKTINRFSASNIFHFSTDMQFEAIKPTKTPLYINSYFNHKAFLSDVADILTNTLEIANSLNLIEKHNKSYISKLDRENYISQITKTLAPLKSILLKFQATGTIDHLDNFDKNKISAFAKQDQNLLSKKLHMFVESRNNIFKALEKMLMKIEKQHEEKISEINKFVNKGISQHNQAKTMVENVNAQSTIMKILLSQNK